jgi:hypothetical protein
MGTTWTGTIGTVTDVGNGTYTATVTSPTATGSGIFVATLGGQPVKSGTGSQTQSTITYVPGAATKYLVSSSSYSPVAGSNVTITAQLADANNNAVSTAGNVVTWNKTGTGGSFGSPTSTTNASGVATVTFTTNTVAGTVHTVTGTDAGSLTGTTSNITTTVGAATKYLVTSSSSTPVAGSNVTITAQLADANNNAVSTAGNVVTWSKTGTGGSFGSPTSTTNASGVATVTFTTSTVAGTVHTVTGTDAGSLTGTTSNITTTVGAATKYLVTSSSSSPVAGSNVTITAQLADANNNAVSTAGKIVTWSKTGTGGSFGAPTSTTNASGVATVTFTTNTVAGTVHTVTGTDNTSLTGTTSNITTTPGAATKYLVTSSSSTPVAGSNVTITAQLADANNNAVSTAGNVVTWSKTGTGGSFGAPTSTTNASGIATVTFTTSTVAGTVHTVTGTDAGSLTGTTSNITTTVGTATKYLVTSSSSTPIAGSNVTITAQLADANNNAVSTAGKIVTWSKTGTGGSFGSPTSTTNASGVATVTFTTNTVAGTVHTVTGTDNTSLTGTTSNITTTPGAATKYLVTSSSGTPVAGSSVTITAQLADANNNAVSTAGNVVTWSKTGTGGSFGAPTSTTNASGVATVTFTTNSVAGTVHTVTGTDAGSLTGTTSNITTTPGAATKYLVTSSSSTPVAGSNVTITAQLADANNNAVSTAGKVVTWSKTGTGGSFGSPTSTTNASGVATVTFTTHTVSATVHTVTGTDNTSLSGTSSAITTTFGVATKLSIGQQPTNAIAGASVNPAVTVQIQDANGNIVTSDNATSVSFALGNNPGGGTLSGSLSVTANSGTATFSDLSINKAGTGYTLVATSVPALTSATSAGFNITAGAVSVSQSVVSVVPDTIAYRDSAAVVLQARDTYGNNLTSGGSLVAFSLTGGGTSSGTFGTVKDNLDGTYSAQFTGMVAGTATTVSATIGGSAVTSTLPTITVVPRKVVHRVVLPQGWNMISSFVAPNVSLMDTVFAKVRSHMVIAKNGAGQVYWPAFSINQIGSWNKNNGYQVYMQLADTMIINGNEIDPQANPIALPQGWNMVSYLKNNGMRSDSALASLGANLVIAKNNAGQVYWPAFSINQIGSMKPGQGYQMYLSSGSTLTYPANPAGSPPSMLTKKMFAAQSMQEVLAPEHFNPSNKETGSNGVLLVESAGLSNGDEIGVFGKSKELIGSGVVADGKAVVTVWGDNTITKESKEGAEDGEILTLSIWSKSDQKEREAIVEAISDALTGQKGSGQLVFRTDGVWIVQAQAVKQVPTVFSLEQNYPNPFNPTTTISYGIPSDGKVSLEIYNLLGQKVATLVDQEQKAGFYQVVFKADALASGMYVYVIKTGEFSAAKKLMLLK